VDPVKGNVHDRTVEGFGREWETFDQSRLDDASRAQIFAEYFRIFPWDELARDAVGADVGCGSGRWAALVAPRVGRLFLVDPSPRALEVARKNLAGLSNCTFFHGSVDDVPVEDASLDFAYCLGVLHHVPDPAAGIRSIALKLKPGAPLLVYVYYAFDDRPAWFRILWRTTDVLRRIVSRLPFPLRYVVSQSIAALVYLPLASAARWLEARGKLPGSWPLAYYRNKPFYVMRTDALDRFGTRLEHRVSRVDLETMLRDAGFGKIVFADRAPYWCAVGWKR
jgi:SAM-dependent methyltransferase